MQTRQRENTQLHTEHTAAHRTRSRTQNTKLHTEHKAAHRTQLHTRFLSSVRKYMEGMLLL